MRKHTRDGPAWSPFGCPDALGVPFYLSVRGTTIASAQKLRERIPLDALITGIHVEAIESGGGRTVDFGINIQDSASEDFWFLTAGNDLGQGSVVPASLVSGGIGMPFVWDAPRILRENNTLEVSIEPTVGVTLAYVCITFIGRRLRGAEAEMLCSADSRGSGYGCIVTDPIQVTWEGQGVAGAEVRHSLQVDAKPYDFLMSRTSLIIVEDLSGNRFTPLQGALAEVSIRIPTFRHEHMTDPIPSSLFGGMLMAETAGPEDYARPVSSPDGACWRVSQQSTLEVMARALRRPTGGVQTSFYVQMAFHGQRVLPERLPSYLHEGRAGLIERGCPPRLGFPEAGAAQIQMRRRMERSIRAQMSGR